MKRFCYYWVLGWIAFMGCVTGAYAQNSAKIGYVDVDVLMQKMPQARDAVERLREEFSERRAEMEECAEKLQGMNDRLKKESKRLSDAARSRLNRTIVKTRRDCKRMEEELQEDVNQRRNTELRAIQKQVNAVILEIAERGRYDIIFSGPVIYRSEQIDLTSEVLRSMDRNTGNNKETNP